MRQQEGKLRMKTRAKRDAEMNWEIYKTQRNCIAKSYERNK